MIIFAHIKKKMVTPKTKGEIGPGRVRPQILHTGLPSKVQGILPQLNFRQSFLYPGRVQVVRFNWTRMVMGEVYRKMRVTDEKKDEEGLKVRS